VKKIKAIEFNRAHVSHGYNVRWVENVSGGLRLVGYADKIAHLRHQGWFTYDDGDRGGEVLRGIVYRLPARDGKEQYVYGYEDPNNDDCALICFEAEDTAERAARAADRFAEIFAEAERDYHRAWDAGQRCRSIDEEVKEIRSETLALGAEMRAARRLAVRVPMICNVLREKIASNYRSIVKLRKERDELVSNYRRDEAFKDGRIS
jgi:hypothetical protein